MSLDKILAIRKLSDNSFETFEYDPYDGIDDSEKNVIDRYSKCGLLIDVDERRITMLSIGPYNNVLDKFANIESQYRQSSIPEMADNLRCYDVSSALGDDIARLLSNTGYAESFLKTYTKLPYIQGSSWDDAVIVED